MDSKLRACLEALRDERASHQQAADALLDQLRETIREEILKQAASVNIRALSEASGLSRPTIYSLLPGGRRSRSR